MARSLQRITDFGSEFKPIRWIQRLVSERTMYNLSGKIALVTGVGGEFGIERAIAMRLAEDGADFAISDLAQSLHIPTADRTGLGCRR